LTTIDLAKDVCHVIEAVTQFAKTALGSVCHKQTLALAAKELDAEMRLKDFDLLTNGCRRDSQLVCRAGKAEMTGCSLEGAHSVQRWETASHGPTLHP
jgi:hypothetical protein